MALLVQKVGDSSLGLLAEGATVRGHLVQSNGEVIEEDGLVPERGLARLGLGRSRHLDVEVVVLMWPRLMLWWRMLEDWGCLRRKKVCVMEMEMDVGVE